MSTTIHGRRHCHEHRRVRTTIGIGFYAACAIGKVAPDAVIRARRDCRLAGALDHFISQQQTLKWLY
jgi:hypothetical protein